MKIHHPWLIRLLGFVFFLVLRLWTKTLRYRIAFLDGRRHPTPTTEDRFIYAFWHDLIFVPTVVRANLHVLISKHRDGEWLAQICRRLGYGAVRGSTNHGGTEAMRQLLDKSKTTHLSMTPDGPRGPRRCVNPGIIYLASRSGLPIIPCGIGMSQSWQFSSWDRFAVPFPFSEVTFIYGKPIHVPPKLHRDEMEEYRMAVEEQLNSVTQTAQMWVEQKRTRLFNKLRGSFWRRIARILRFPLAG